MAGGGACGECGSEASLRCGGCSAVHYCSREHQRKHWVIHKDECWPVTQARDPQCGRYLVATRDLKEGQLVLREKPLVLGPVAESPPVCLGCHAPITAEDHPRCQGCSWPLCSPACATTARHQAECAALATDTKKIAPPTSMIRTPRYDVILVLRCLLLRSLDPTSWEKIKRMDSHSESRKESKEETHIIAIKYFSEVLQVDCDAETASHVHGAIITNAINTYGASGDSLRGLYPTLYLMNHSCLPNVTLRSDLNRTLFVRAAVPIKKGQPLLFSYLPPTDPVWRRQADLYSIYFFKCACERCRDPTELGTYFSNPRCSACAEGFLEPSGGSGAPWSCPGCGAQRPEDDVVKEAEDFVQDIDNKFTSFTDVCKHLARIENTFHNNHFVWLTAAKAAMSILSKETTTQSLCLRRDLWRRLIHLYQRLEPGSTRRRGVSLFNSAVVERDAALLHLSSSGGKRSAEFEEGLNRAVNMLDAAIPILELEPPDSAELRWLLNARAEKEVIYDLISGGKPVEYQ
nr:SET domain-containing protein SmydA-8-like [Procambarus clarkii]XP_045583673.1 SET domain-containing protein SmydA-8-like [Procambarus clarkii]